MAPRWMFTNQGDKLQIDEGDDKTEIEEYYAEYHDSHGLRFEIEDKRLKDAEKYIRYECLEDTEEIARENLQHIDENLMKRLEEEGLPCTVATWEKVVELLLLRSEDTGSWNVRSEQRELENSLQEQIQEADEEEFSESDQSEAEISEGESDRSEAESSESESEDDLRTSAEVSRSVFDLEPSSDLPVHAPTNTQPVPVSPTSDDLPDYESPVEDVPQPNPSRLPEHGGRCDCHVDLIPWRPHAPPERDARSTTKQIHREYAYGGHVSRPEIWYKYAPQSLPFPETLALQEWESLRIQYEMDNKLSTEPCVDTDISFGHPRLVKYLDVPQFETGSRFTLPNVLPEIAEDIEGFSKRSELPEQIDKMCNKPANMAGGAVPPVFLDKFKLNPKAIRKVDPRQVIMEILNPKKTSMHNASPDHDSSEENVEPAPSNNRPDVEPLTVHNQLRTVLNSSPTPRITREKKKVDFAPAFESARRRSASRVSPNEPEIGSDFEDTVIVNRPQKPQATPRRSRRGGAVARRISIERAEAIRTSPPQQSATPTNDHVDIPSEAQTTGKNQPKPTSASRKTRLSPEEQLIERGFPPAVPMKPLAKKAAPSPSGARSRKRKHEADKDFSIYIDEMPNVNPTRTSARNAKPGPSNKRPRVRTPELEEDFSLYEDAAPVPTPTPRHSAGKRKRTSPRGDDEEYTPDGQRKASVGSNEYAPPKTGLRGQNEKNDDEIEVATPAKRRKVEKTAKATGSGARASTRKEKRGRGASGSASAGKSDGSVGPVRRSTRVQKK